jgi:hypothetical protein
VVKEWGDEIARQLREPLPADQIGKLPKIPRAQQNDRKQGCRYCGGYHVPIADNLHVDYVAHAIVTDKLNTIVGQDGWGLAIDLLKESKDGEHVIGILATLTIAGLSKQEAGDPGKRSTWGEELKLAISDWLPRAAMRFGLGLEVWAKQPLDKVIVEDAHEPERPAQQRRQEQARPAPGTAAKAAQQGAMVENGMPTVDAIEWLSKLARDADGLLEARALLDQCSTAYKRKLKEVAEKRFGEGGYKTLWNNVDLSHWSMALLDANAQMIVQGKGEAA